LDGENIPAEPAPRKSSLFKRKPTFEDEPKEVQVPQKNAGFFTNILSKSQVEGKKKGFFGFVNKVKKLLDSDSEEHDLKPEPSSFSRPSISIMFSDTRDVAEQLDAQDAQEESKAEPVQSE
jgi:hypothetical protein